MPTIPRADAARYQRNRRHRFKEDGACSTCGGTRPDNRLTCEPCRRAAKQRSKQRYRSAHPGAQQYRKAED